MITSCISNTGLIMDAELLRVQGDGMGGGGSRLSRAEQAL